MQARPGATLSHYRLLEKIGEGGMGVVYKALDTRLNRHVAVKLLPAGLTDDPERRRRFLHEARAAAAVTHARIAAVHDVDECEGAVFIVMELVAGQSLRSFIRDRPLPIPQALRIATEVADGLAHAHEAHIVHRDLKPENVVIDQEGHAKILDFGLARLLEQRQEELRSQLSQADTVSGQLTREGQIVGTAAYMSPEQARGTAVDARSDLFSFGTLLYEMVTGRRPFQGVTPIETLSAILKDTPPPASRWNEAVPPAVEAVLARCLQKDPAQRYPSAAALRSDLEQLVTGGALPAVARARRFSSRSVLALAGAVVGLAVAAVLVTLVVRRGPSPDAGAPGRIQSLAVLPLRNLSGDPEQEYFTDGMTDELITHLSRIGALRVISRSSSMRYKGTTKPPAEIARELKVDALVEGSVQRSGDRVRVSASLVRAATDSSLWAESYERDLRDVLALQSEVAGAIATTVQAKLTPQERERLAASRPVDPEAYQLYLRGRHEWNKFTEPALRGALEHFRKALDEDPGYAPAYLGIADVYLIMSGAYMDSGAALPKARAAAQRAIQLDATLAGAHATLASVAQSLDRDWPGAEVAFRRALELDPSHAMAHNLYGLFLSYLGRTEEAVGQMRQAQALDPLSSWIAVGLAYPYIYALPEKRNYRRAIEILENVVEMDSAFLNAHATLALAHSQLRQCGPATQEADRAMELAAGDPGLLVYLGSIYAACGDQDRARDTLARVPKGNQRGHVSPGYIAMIFVALGETESALSWLEVAFEKGDEVLVTAAVEPRFDGLRSDPRFIDLLRRLKLPLQ